MSRFLSSLAYVVITSFAVLASQVATAQGNQSRFIEQGDETLMINLGGVVDRFDTTIRLDGTSGRGSEVNLEKNGAQRTVQSFTASGTWRFLSRNRIDIAYFGSNSRSNTRQTDRDFTIDGEVIAAGASLSTEAKSQIFSADYRFSFIKTDALEFAGLIGVYGGYFKFDVNAVGNVSGTTKTFTTSASTPVPLPLIGLTVDWYVTPRWRISGNVEGLKAKIGDVDGSIFMAGVGTDYMLTRNLGLGLSFYYTNLNVDVSKSSFNGKIGWTTDSALAYARIVF